MGNFSSTPPAPRIGGAPLEELLEIRGVDRVSFFWSGVESTDLFGYFFME